MPAVPACRAPCTVLVVAKTQQRINRIRGARLAGIVIDDDRPHAHITLGIQIQCAEQRQASIHRIHNAIAEAVQRPFIGQAQRFGRRHALGRRAEHEMRHIARTWQIHRAAKIWVRRGQRLIGRARQITERIAIMDQRLLQPVHTPTRIRIALPL